MEQNYKKDLIYQDDDGDVYWFEEGTGWVRMAGWMAVDGWAPEPSDALSLMEDFNATPIATVRGAQPEATPVDTRMALLERQVSDMGKRLARVEHYVYGDEQRYRHITGYAPDIHEAPTIRGLHERLQALEERDTPTHPEDTADGVIEWCGREVRARVTSSVILDDWPRGTRVRITKVEEHP